MLKVGDKAPDFKAEASNGKTITLSEFQVRVIKSSCTFILKI